MSDVIDTDTITTDAGDYVVSWFYDEDSESPLADDTAIQVYITGGRNETYADTIDTSTPAGNALSTWLVEYVNNEYRYGSDSDAVVRRYEKWRAITGSPWQLFTGSGHGNIQSHWWNWYLLIDTTAGFSDVAKAAQSIMDEYESWASGEVYWFTVTGPDESLVSSVGGFIGDDGRKYALIDYVRPAINYGVEQRQKNASLVGAGFVGLI